MIEVRNLCKAFGERTVVSNLSFSVGKGEILGFLGPNGAGKTTTMRMLTCFKPPTSGTATICGFDIVEQPLEVKKRIGYLPEHPPLYLEMTPASYLQFCAEIKRVPRPEIEERVEWALGRCGLGEVRERLIGNLSKGFRQRVGLAQAILAKPEVLILDEPTIGLDPRQIREIRELIKELGREHTIILSTHILPEVTMTCAQVVIINRGRIAASGPIASLTHGKSLEETFLELIGSDEAAPASATA